MEQPKEIAVVKYGSSSVAHARGMNSGRVNNYARRIDSISNQYDVVIASSGAIATGEAMWKSQQRGRISKRKRRSLASMGSGQAFIEWQRALAAHGRLAGQVMVTNHEIDDSEEGRAVKELLRDNIELGIISVANGNDATSTEGAKDYERSKDNDHLAAHIAKVLGAKHLLFLTNKRGLLEDPQDHKSLVHEVTVDNIDWALSLAGDAGPQGKGGMRSKVSEAYSAAQSGINAHIAANWLALGAIIQFKHGYGTHFPAQ